MTAVKTRLILLVSIILATAAAPAHAKSFGWRSLSDGQGGTIEARFEGIRDGRYLLRRAADGKLFEVPPDLLTGTDRDGFDADAKRLDAELKKLAEMCGHPLFSGTPFEVRDASEIAGILGLPQESKTAHSASWRSYTGSSYRMFGARPYSVALYADGEGRPTILSVVFANKGDFRSTAGSGEDHFSGGSEASADSLAKAMEGDESTVLSAITKALGAPRTQRYGDSRATRRTVNRWDWNGHSMLLSSVEGEYVSLSIVPVQLADGGGRTARVKDGEIRKRLAADVVREENGDVFLGQVPMVNQGPKGYCVPATFERAMRTMGIEADMYLLAMVGKSGMGGGTSVEFLMEEVERQVRSKGRRTKTESLRELRVRDVKRAIDDGIPVMWTMRSLPEYNRIANENTAERSRVEDWAKWKKRVAAQAEEFEDKESPSENHHICLITGYNEATNELAVSDSWGPQYERRWVPAPVADWASGGKLFLILP